MFRRHTGKEVFESAEKNGLLGTWSWLPSKKVFRISPGAAVMLNLKEREVREEVFIKRLNLKDSDFVKWLYDTKSKESDFYSEIIPALPDKTRFSCLHIEGFRQPGNGSVCYGILMLLSGSFSPSVIPGEDLFFRWLADHQEDTLWVCDKGLTIRYISTNIINRTGYKADDLIGRNISEVLPALPENQVNEWLNELNSINGIKAGEQIDKGVIIHELKHKESGRLIPFEVYYSPYLNIKGELAGFYGTLKDITQKKELSDKLSESELHFRLAASRFGIYFFRIDISTGKVFYDPYVNDFIKSAGLTIPENFEEWLQFIHPDDLKEQSDGDFKNIFTSTEKDKIYHYTFRIKKPDGSWSWVDVHAKPDADSGGKITGITGIGMDISDRKRIESKVHEQEKKYQSLYNNIPVAVYRSTPEGRIISCNRKMYTLYGFGSEEEFLQRDARSLYVDPAVYDKLIKEVELKGYFLDFETQHYLQNGAKISVRCDYQGIFDDEGKLSYIDGIVEDITAQKKAEQALLESERRYLAIAEHFPDGMILIVNHERKIVYAGGQLLSSLGLKPEVVINRHFKEIFPDNVIKSVYNVGEQIKQNKKASIDISYDNRYFTAQLVPIQTDEKFDFTEALVIACEITEQEKAKNQEKAIRKQLDREVEKQLKALKEQTVVLQESQRALTYLLEDVNETRDELMRVNKDLESANSDLEAFAYSVSHDLRAPLRHIDGFTKLIEDNIDLDNPKVKDYFEKIHKASNRMHNLINDLLTFSRLGRKKLQYTSVNLTELINELIKEHQPDIAGRNIEWEIADIPEFPADWEMIRIAFDNLISNAIKFTGKEEQAIIRVGYRMIDEKKIEISVSDNGVGFDQDYSGKIFGVFERLHPESEFPGTGIGLANVKRIIRSHNGAVRAEGKIGKGATFFVVLPINLKTQSFY